MKKTLGVAIIGQGRSGRNIHGKYLLTDQDRFKVVAVVDAIGRRRERAVEEYGCEAYEDYHELLKRKDIDLVVNSSFSHLHCPITIDLLSHGFNVLTEKPAAKTAEEVQSMIDASKRGNCMFAVFQQSRFAPYFEKVKSILDSGVLGRAVQVSIAFSGFKRRWGTGSAVRITWEAACIIRGLIRWTRRSIYSILKSRKYSARWTEPIPSAMRRIM